MFKISVICYKKTFSTFYNLYSIKRRVFDSVGITLFKFNYLLSKHDNISIFNMIISVNYDNCISPIQVSIICIVNRMRPRPSNLVRLMICFYLHDHYQHIYVYVYIIFVFLGFLWILNILKK